MGIIKMLYEINPFQRFDDWLNSIFSFDERMSSFIEWYLSFPTIIKIPILILVLLLLYLGAYTLIKKIVIGLPKKIVFIIIFVVIVYFVIAYFISK